MTDKRNKMLKERFKKDINDISNQQRQVKKLLKQAHRDNNFDEVRRLERDREYWRQTANKVLGCVDEDLFKRRSVVGW
jgi:hypothetical protein